MCCKLWLGSPILLIMQPLQAKSTQAAKTCICYHIDACVEICIFVVYRAEVLKKAVCITI